MSKQELQQKTTSSEFVDWKVVLFEILPNEIDPILDHLAQLALEIRCFWSETARRTGKIEAFRVKYAKNVPDDDEQDEELSVDERTRRSKAAWGAMLGFSKKNKKGKIELPEKVRKRTEEFRNGLRN